MIDSGLVGQVPRGEKMLYAGTDPESYITEYTLVDAVHCTRARHFCLGCDNACPVVSSLAQRLAVARCTLGTASVAIRHTPSVPREKTCFSHMPGRHTQKKAFFSYRLS